MPLYNVQREVSASLRYGQRVISLVAHPSTLLAVRPRESVEAGGALRKEKLKQMRGRVKGLTDGECKIKTCLHDSVTQ